MLGEIEWGERRSKGQREQESRRGRDFGACQRTLAFKMNEMKPLKFQLILILPKPMKAILVYRVILFIRK